MIKSYGRVSIYVDEAKNLIIIPVGEDDEPGMNFDIDVVLKVSFPYGEMELEYILQKALELCHIRKPYSNESGLSIIERETRIKGYSKVAKKIKKISLYWNDEDGYMVYAWKGVRGGYDGIGEDISLGTKIVPGQLKAAFDEALEMIENEKIEEISN